MTGRRLALFGTVVALLALPLVSALGPGGATQEIGLLVVVVAVAAGFVMLLAESAAPAATPQQVARGLLAVLAPVALMAILLTLLIFIARQAVPSRLELVQYTSVAVFAGGVGFGELLARYRDDPARLLGMRGAVAYVAVNVAAGLLALALVQQFEAISAGPQRPLYEALLAAFGAVAFFRTSLFTARIGDADVGVGPATLLKSFLEGSDRLVNREQAVRRADAVASSMAGVDFDKAYAALPSLCLGLVEGLSAEEQQQLATRLAALRDDQQITPAAKAQILGVYLLRVVGVDVLHRAVTTLGDRIRV